MSSPKNSPACYLPRIHGSVSVRLKAIARPLPETLIRRMTFMPIDSGIYSGVAIKNMMQLVAAVNVRIVSSR